MFFVLSSKLELLQHSAARNVHGFESGSSKRASEGRQRGVVAHFRDECSARAKDGIGSHELLGRTVARTSYLKRCPRSTGSGGKGKFTFPFFFLACSKGSKTKCSWHARERDRRSLTYGTGTTSLGRGRALKVRRNAVLGQESQAISSTPSLAQ